MINIDCYTPEINQITQNQQLKKKEEDDLLKVEKPLNKDNPSDITLNINDFLEEQEALRNFSSYSLQFNKDNDYTLQRRLNYPINDTKCPLYLRYMNLIKFDYKNYSNDDLLNLYDSQKKNNNNKNTNNNNNRIKRKDLLKIATIDGKFNYGIDF